MRSKKTEVKEKLFLVQVTYEVAVLAPDKDVAQSRVLNTKKEAIMEKGAFKGVKVVDHVNGMKVINESDYFGDGD